MSLTPRITSVSGPHWRSHYTKATSKEGGLVAARRTTPEAVMSGKPAWLQDFYKGNDLIKAPGGTPQEVFAAGRVTVGFGDGKSDGEQKCAAYRDASVVFATTGDLAWHGNGKSILLSTAKTQGIIGDLDGTVELSGSRIEGRTAFVSLLFTPLDDQPLAQSKHILITALARDKQTGAKYSEDGTKLLAVGTAPLLLEPVQATIKLAGAKPAAIRPLDHCGVPKKETVPVGKDGASK